MTIKWTERAASAARWILASAILLAAVPGAADPYCARVPPPEGLVDRCHQADIVVAASIHEFEDSVRAWMATCVQRDRAAGLVNGNSSLDEIWSVVGELTGEAVSVIPEYEANSWTQNGDTCYGVAAVRFRLEHEGTVTFGEPEIEIGPTQEDIENSADAALAALSVSQKDPRAVGRLTCVMQRMKRAGKSFDDRYYAAAPGIDLTGDLNPPTCYKEGRYGENGYDYHCRTGPDAIESCARHLTERLVEKVQRGVTGEQLVDWLLYRDDDAYRGVAHLHQMHSSGSAAMICTGVRTLLMPDIAARAKRSDSLLGCY